MKTHNLTQSSLRNDRINRRMHGFSFRVSEDEIEVQDVISPRSLDKILISSIPWTRKRVKNMNKSNGTQIGCLESSNFSKIQGQSFPSRRTMHLYEKFGRDRSMKRRIAINGYDETSVDRVHRSRVKSRVAWSSVGS